MMMLNVPPEILLVILQLLDTSDLLSIRQTCRTIRQATYDRAIWMSLLQEQVDYLPFPTDFLRVYHEDVHLDAYSTSNIESMVLRAQRSSKRWVAPRRSGVGTTIQKKLHRIKREPLGHKLLGLEMAMDRWIMAIYFEGVVRVYDVESPKNTDGHKEGSAPVLCNSLLSETSYMSYAVSMGPSGKTLYLALAHPSPIHTIRLFEVNFDLLSKEQATPTFSLIRTMSLPSHRNIKALSSAERQIVLSLPIGVDIIPWGADNANVESRKVLTSRNEDLDALVDGIVAVTFIGPHLLIFRTHTLSIHDYKGFSKPPFPDLKHMFSLTFRQVSFSDCSMTYNPVFQVETYEMSIFAYDVIQGLFYYTVQLSIPSNGLTPSLDVHLTGVYPLAVGIIQSPSSSAFPATSYFTNFSPRESSPSNSRDSPTSDAEYGSRGFLSAYCVGPQAKRAVWVERKRSSITREVHVWSRERPTDDSVYVSGRLDGSGRRSEGESADSGQDASTTMEMKRRVVYSLNSYDLRDDINYCALGEVSGTIVLGHRSGDITVLKL